jgi:hypothetical protein
VVIVGNYASRSALQPLFNQALDQPVDLPFLHDDPHTKEVERVVANWRHKAGAALLTLLAVAVAARLVWGLLWPLMPYGIAIVVIGSVLVFAVRGPRGR